jgi:hypothetical protein
LEGHFSKGHALHGVAAGATLRVKMAMSTISCIDNKAAQPAAPGLGTALRDVFGLAHVQHLLLIADIELYSVYHAPPLLPHLLLSA